MMMMMMITNIMYHVSSIVYVIDGDMILCETVFAQIGLAPQVGTV